MDTVQKRRDYTVQVKGADLRVAVKNVYYMGFLQGVRVSFRNKGGKILEFPKQGDYAYGCYNAENDEKAVTQALIDARLLRKGQSITLRKGQSITLPQAEGEEAPEGLICPFCGEKLEKILQRRMMVTVDDAYDVVSVSGAEVSVEIDGGHDSYIEETPETKTQWLCPHCWKDLSEAEEDFSFFID